MSTTLKFSFLVSSFSTRGCRKLVTHVKFPFKFNANLHMSKLSFEIHTSPFTKVPVCIWVVQSDHQQLDLYFTLHVG